MSGSSFRGFGGAEQEVKKDRSILSFKELNIEEHMALQIFTAMVRAEDCHYANRDDKNGNVIHGEERYAIDAILGARYLMKCSNMSNQELSKRQDEIDELLSYTKEDDEDAE